MYFSFDSSNSFFVWKTSPLIFSQSSTSSHALPTNTLALSEVIAVTHLVYISSLLSFQATDKYKAQTITSSLPRGRPCITRLTSGKSRIHMGLEIFLLCTKQIHSWMILCKVKTRISNLNFLLTSSLTGNVFLWREKGVDTGWMSAVCQALCLAH